MIIKKIIFICNDDKFYTLPTLYSIVKSQSLLNIKVEKILVSKYKSKSSSLLYRLKFLKNISNFYRLFLYIVYLLINRFVKITKGNVSFNHLSKKYNIDIEFVESLNKLSTNEVKDLSNKIDLGIIMIDEVLAESFIQNFSKLIINKHSSMLPEGRGLFTYMRIFTDNIQPGITFHEVIKDIDAGVIFHQKRIDNSQLTSMVKFYKFIFDNYYLELNNCLINIKNNNIITNNFDNSYYSLPKDHNFKEFKQSNGSLIKASDFLNLFR